MNNNNNFNNNQVPNIIPPEPPAMNVENSEIVNQNVINNNQEQINQVSNLVIDPAGSTPYVNAVDNASNNINTPNLNYQQPTNIDLNSQMINNAETNKPVENQNNNMINNLNIDGTYNGIQAPDYVNEPIVRENIERKKKNTITITKELKTVIIIALVLLVFIIIMPMFFDLLNNIRFH